MEQYIIKGGNPLVGDVTVSGAKNAALGILAASIMTNEDVLIDNLPDVKDINVMLEAIQEIGARVERVDRHTVRINGGNIKEVSVDDEFIRRIRASYYFIGALLGKYKSAQVPLPGGCNIGSRPIDQHIKGFRALGAEVVIERGTVFAHAIDLRGILGVEMFIGRDGEIYINELAPRPHNSGHYSIEACNFSQFAIHNRAVCNWPLPKIELLKPAVMVNVLGQHVAGVREQISQKPNWHFHDYGKAAVRHNRKMGHVTILTDDVEQTLTEIDNTGIWSE